MQVHVPFAGHQLHRDVEQPEGYGAAPDGSCRHGGSPCPCALRILISVIPARAGMKAMVGWADAGFIGGSPTFIGIPLGFSRTLVRVQPNLRGRVQPTHEAELANLHQPVRGNAWRISSKPCHGSCFKVFNRRARLAKVYCAPDFSRDNSSQRSGVATPAPGRARTQYEATAVEPRALRR